MFYELSKIENPLYKNSVGTEWETRFKINNAIYIEIR